MIMNQQLEAENGETVTTSRKSVFVHLFRSVLSSLPSSKAQANHSPSLMVTKQSTFEKTVDVSGLWRLKTFVLNSVALHPKTAVKNLNLERSCKCPQSK